MRPSPRVSEFAATNDVVRAFGGGHIPSPPRDDSNAAAALTGSEVSPNAVTGTDAASR